MPDRPPSLNDGEAPLQQFFGFVGQDVAHALRGRPFSVVVVHAPDDFADLLRLALFIISGAQRVIEYDHTFGTALGLDQRFHLRIVDAPNFVLVVKILDFGVVAHKAKAVTLQSKIIRMGPAIVNGHAPRIRRAAGARIGTARTGDYGEDLVAVVDDVIERGFDVIGREVKFGGLGNGHGGLPVVASI